MMGRLVGALALAALLAGCATYDGPTATCFSLMEAQAPCDFRAVAGQAQ